MHDLEVLDGILDVDEPAGAVFHIHGAWFDKLFQLLPPEVEGDIEIPGLAAVDVSIPVGFDLFPQRGVSGDGAQLDHGLSFEGCGQTGGAVVADDLLQWIGEGTLAAMGAQANVEVEDAFLLGLDALQEFLREPLEVFAVLDALFPVGAPHAAVDEEHFDVRSIARAPGLRICPCRARQRDRVSCSQVAVRRIVFSAWPGSLSGCAPRSLLPIPSTLLRNRRGLRHRPYASYRSERVPGP